MESSFHFFFFLILKILFLSLSFIIFPIISKLVLPKLFVFVLIASNFFTQQFLIIYTRCYHHHAPYLMFLLLFEITTRDQEKNMSDFQCCIYTMRLKQKFKSQYFIFHCTLFHFFYKKIVCSNSIFTLIFFFKKKKRVKIEWQFHSSFNSIHFPNNGMRNLLLSVVKYLNNRTKGLFHFI